MTTGDYSRSHGAGHGAERAEPRAEPDALTRKARDRREADELLARMRESLTPPRCTCGHPQTDHDDGTGQCMDFYRVSDDEDVDCWCTQFTQS